MKKKILSMLIAGAMMFTMSTAVSAETQPESSGVTAVICNNSARVFYFLNEPRNNLYFRLGEQPDNVGRLVANVYELAWHDAVISVLELWRYDPVFAMGEVTSTVPAGTLLGWQRMTPQSAHIVTPADFSQEEGNIEVTWVNCGCAESRECDIIGVTAVICNNSARVFYFLDEPRYSVFFLLNEQPGVGRYFANVAGLGELDVMIFPDPTETLSADFFRAAAPIPAGTMLGWQKTDLQVARVVTPADFSQRDGNTMITWVNCGCAESRECDVAAFNTRDNNAVGHVLGAATISVGDALAILRYTVGLPSILNTCPDAYQAALIVSEDTPGVRDALQILRSVVGLPSVLD
jgi:hypothetical protein